MNVKVDMGCPIELFSYELPTEDFEAVSLLLFNLSDKMVTSVQTTVILYDAQGEMLSRHMERVLDLKGESKMSFVADVPVKTEVQPACVDVVFEKIWFDDSFVWRRGNTAMTEYEIEPIANQKTLEMLRFLAGENAICFPKELKHLWVCVCGRANGYMDEVCARCGRTHDDVFRHYNKETVEAVREQRDKELDEIALSARKAASDMDAQREKEALDKKKKRKRVTALLTSLVIVLALAYGTVFHLLPYLRYQEATKLFSAKQYDEAKAAFAQMADYKDADEMMLLCDYDKAQAYMVENTPEDFLKAHDAFAALGDFKDAQGLAKKALYDRAGLLTAKPDLLAAAEAYEELGDYEDAAAKAFACRFENASNLMAGGDFKEAQAAFKTLEGDEALEMEKECRYLMAGKALELKNFQEAASAYEALGDYKDSAALKNKTYYTEAESFFALGEFEKAGESFLKCGDYEDAKARAGECLYERAIAAMNSRDYEKALGLFTSLGVYKEAELNAKKCHYQLGIIALAESRFDAAEAHFDAIPKYMDVDDQQREVKYQRALAALESGEYDAAAEGFNALEGHGESGQKALEATYLKGQNLITAGEYEQGIALLKELGNYEQAPEKVREASYEWAQMLYTDLNDEKVIELLSPFEDYLDSKNMLMACRYRLAKDALAREDIQQAFTQFEALGEYEDAPALLNDCRYRLAVQKETEGDMVAASSLYAACGDYSDARDKLAAIAASYYGGILGKAEEAYHLGDLKTVADMLRDMDTSTLPLEFKALETYRNEANYKVANDLYNAGKPYEALPYYRAIEGYKDVADKMLPRNAYKILGSWVTADGTKMVFNEDGTCTLGDESLYFSVRNYTMSTGSDAESLKATHSVSRLTKTDLTLRDNRGGKIVTYRLTREGE